MKSYSANEIVLVQYPFSDLSALIIRPAIIINSPHQSQDVIIVPLTSKTTQLLPGEFILAHWKTAGLNTVSAVKRGIFTIAARLIVKSIGSLDSKDAAQLEKTVLSWLCW